MNETITYCVRGCTRRRYHLTECVEDECRGCQPRTAQHGLLCWPCHRRFELMLTQADIVERWLTGNLPTNVTAATARNDAEQIRGSKEAPAPLKVAILDQRQLLRDRLACWADDLSQAKELTGPATHSVTADAKFLLTWLTTIEHLEWIGDWFEEMAETMSDAHSLAPWRPEVNKIRSIPCPECHMQALVIYGGESDVTCTECRHIMTSARYGIWTEILAEENEAAG